jgi:methionyl-tRNA formyltransferase
MDAGSRESDLRSGPARLRLAIITEDDPLYVRAFFEEFVHDPRLPHVADVQCVLLQPPFRESRWKLARRMLGFWGPLGFVRTAIKLAWLRGHGRTCRRVLHRAGFVCRDETDVNSTECVSQLRHLSLDVILSVAAPQIFREPLLQVPSWGCINVHSGCLPRYRGMMPVFWQMAHAERQIGVTVHTITEEIDGGDILKQVLTDTVAGESLTAAILRTKRLGARMVVEVLQDIQAGRVTRTPMNIREGSYFSFPKPAEVRAFCHQGGKLW